MYESLFTLSQGRAPRWGLRGALGLRVIPNHSLDDIPVAQPIGLNVRVTQSLLQLLDHVLRAEVRHLLEWSRGSSHSPPGNSWAPSGPDVKPR